ncbi:MAG: OmpA family protein [Bacteroidota bacterium]
MKHSALHFASCRRPWLFLLGLMLAAALPAQSGEEFKGTALGPQVNTEYDELLPRFSPNGQTLYFVRTDHPRGLGGQDIWRSRQLADGSWSTAVNLGEPLNDERHNAIGGIASSGGALLLSNIYGDQPTPGIAIALRQGEGWTAPKPLLTEQTLGVAVNYLGFCVDAEYSVMFISMSRKNNPKANEDLFVSLRGSDGAWGAPFSVGGTINSSGSEISPFLSEDQRTLFFASDGHGAGSMDIYRVQRTGEGWTEWSTPENLGPAVNTAGFDGHFVLAPGEAEAYFVSGPNTDAAGDIYRVSVADIPALAPRVTVAVSDTLRIFAKENTPLPVSFVDFGITGKNAPLTTTRSLDGKGRLVVREEVPHFIYRPARDFAGTETLELTLCDPPHSDDCDRVIVVAEVAPAAAMPPSFVTLRARTPRNTPVKLELGGRVPEMVDLRRSNAERQPPQGTVALNREVEGEHIFYRPAPDFTGQDTIELYRQCDLPNPLNCLLARVIVDVYQDVALVDAPVEPVEVEPREPSEPVAIKPNQPEEPTEPVAEVAGDVLIFGKTTDEKTGQPIGAELTFYALPESKLLGTINSDPKTGAYEIRLPAGVQYTIAGQEKYHFAASTLVPASARQRYERNLLMEPLPTEVGSVFQLENIYFDLDKSILKPESRQELSRLYAFLKANATVKIRIEGHTDNQATDEYNLALSQSRAQAVVNYLKYKGVMGYRLDAKGFGESVPIATNETEDGRALNRRVEFRIVEK